jgi:hypothetical protein
MMELADTMDESVKKIKGEVAELSRPARAIEEKIKDNLKGERDRFHLGPLKTRTGY